MNLGRTTFIANTLLIFEYSPTSERRKTNIDEKKWMYVAPYIYLRYHRGTRGEILLQCWTIQFMSECNIGDTLSGSKRDYRLGINGAAAAAAAAAALCVASILGLLQLQLVVMVFQVNEYLVEVH